MKRERGEIPDVAPHALTRRGLFEAAGAVAALAGAEACSRGPQEYIVPYVNQPPELTPGVPQRYATTMTLGALAVGLVVESHEGRPTKAEGNPAHPASLGALGTFQQAVMYELYEPSRMRVATRLGDPASWSDFAEAIARPAPSGKKTHVLLEPTCSPHVIDLIGRARGRGDVVVHFDAPVSRLAEWQGTKLALGRAAEARWDFSRADVVLALASDFLAVTTAPMSWALGWASRRRLENPSDSMSRLYVVEPRLTVTGMIADDRRAVQPTRVREVAIAVLANLASPENPAGKTASGRPRGEHDEWAKKVAADLRAHAGACAVIAGEEQPAEVHALACAMNFALGNVGKTVTFGAPAAFEAGEPSHGLDLLVHAIDAGEVGALVIVGGDPLYTSAPDLDLARRLKAVPLTAYVGLYPNATARACEWATPEAHFLEAWTDATAFDGTPSIGQPLMRSLVEGRTVGQILAALTGQPDASSHELVEAFWQRQLGADFANAWRSALVQGVVAGRAPAPLDLRIDWGAIASVLAAPPEPRAPLEISFFADARVYDGRFGNIPQLQELPDPVTKLTWDNAALLSPETASAHGVETGQVVELEVHGRVVRAPVVVVPRMAQGTVAIAVGYGQEAPDLPSRDVGVNAYVLRDSRAPWFDRAVVRKTSESRELAFSQLHASLEGRPIVLGRTKAEYAKDPDFAKSLDDVPSTLYELKPNAPQQWGMTIDLNTCTGCSACVIACMAENNVPVVGKAEVQLGREMHWLRIDRYYDDTPGRAPVVTQPMLCQHCEKAPCEYVCPVNATVHSPDGLNEMIYNRCVGTRFCSNNCPYKVRRFNYFNYNWQKPPSLYLAMNPDVTVRGRGVMEKCTYCVQRIREAEIVARREDRRIRDGEVVTACQQTCPTGTITFGDIADPNSAVSRTRKNDRLYEVLESLGTLPRTRYLARITNPNPDLNSG